MKTNPLAVVSTPSLAVALLVSFAGLPAVAAVFDDFESYAVGSNLHGQGGWSGWAGDPGAGALVSATFSFSPTRSVNVTGATDLVHPFSGVTNGQWVFKMMQYVPSTSSGTNYVILLNSYRPPFSATELNWSVQIQNNMDTGQIISDLGAGATRPMVKDQWVETRVEINLASNTVAEFYNGQPLSTHVWQDGTGLNELQALDLFADNSGPVYYDNVSLAPAAPPADAPATALHISDTGPNLEGLPTFKLEWDAISNATYLVQSADSLAPGSPWTTLDAVIVPDKAGSYQIQVVATDSTGLLSPTKFYRLVLPQTKIFSVEPAVVAPGVPVDFYVIGQCFPTNVELRIKGLPQSGTIYQSSTTLVQPSFVPDVPGDYQFDLVVGGVVKSSFTVTCADPLTNPEMVLQGPPSTPPASPSYTAGPKHSRSNVSNNRTSGGGGGSGGGIRENDNVVFEVQEGKKGLNAVNVKLARSDGGGATVGKPSARSDGGGATVGKPSPGRCMVVTFSGEVQECGVDMVIPGRGLDFVWVRTYNSRIGRTGAAVNGWTFSYDVSIQPLGGDIVIHNGTGRADTFKPDTNGVYTCPEFFSEGTLSNNVFKLTFADTGYWEFNPLTTSADAGKLAKIVDRNGNTMLLIYDVAGRLTQVVDDLDRTNTIAYNTAGQLASVTDFSGRTVRYEYDGNGDLVACISPPVIGTPNGNDFPGGKTNRYTYSNGYLDDRENHLLLSVIDATGQTIYKHVYQHNQTDFEFLRCISVQHWTNTPTILTYLPQTPAPSNQFATLRCIVNDPVGNVSECFFDARGRCVRLDELTGYATPGAPVTDVANRPTGKRRQEDPDGRSTWWRWNNDSLCTSETSPGGQQVQCVYESDFDKSTRARKRADCRVVREIASSPVDLDGDGVADATERVWRYDYDPRFGSDPTARHHPTASDPYPDPPNCCGYACHAINTKGTGTAGKSAGMGMGKGMYEWLKASYDGLVPVGNGVAIKTKGTGAEANRSLAGGDDADRDLWPNTFVTSMIDPRGNVTTGTFDAKGNRVKVKFYWDRQSSADLDFSYNAAGQLTVVTNAPDANGHRRVDVIEYYSSGPQAGRRKVEIVDVVSDTTDDPVAARTSYEYDPRGNVTRIVDPRTNDWLYTYNSLDQLVQTKSALLGGGGGGGGGGGWRIRTQFSYDANDNLTLVAEENLDATGTPGTNPFWRTQFVYDGGQRLTGCWRDKNGALVLRCTEVKYNAADQVVLYRSPEAVNGHDPLNTLAYEYDERGLHYRTIAAPGSSVQSTTQYDYDANGNVTRVSEGLEGTPSVTTFEYDGLIDMKDQSLKEVLGTFTLVGCGLKKFDWAPKLEGGTEGLAWVETVWNKQCVEKDTTVRCSKITDPMGNVTTFNYDANDNLKVIRHFGQTNDVPGTNGNIRLAESRYEYDGLDRPIRERDSFFSLPSQAPIGDGERTTALAYAPNSQCTSITDDLGRVTTFAYDTASRLSSVSSPGARTVYARFFDAAGNVTRATQTDTSDLGGPPQVFSWTSIFDELNRCVSTADNVGNTTSFAYDSRDNCTSMTDPKGNETVYAYDGLSRGLSFTASQGAAASGIVVSSGQFDYDDNDRCVSSTDANGNVTLRAYDPLDRLTQTTQADGTHQSLVWSPRSNLIQETDANGTVITHTYDANDRCVSNHITPGAGVAATTTFETFGYDGCSRLVSATNDVSYTEFDYDSLGDEGGGHTDGWNVLSTYDSVGRRTSLTYPGGRVLTYAYDALDQCTTIVENGAPLVSFAYDGAGRVARVAYGNGMRTRVFYDGISGTPNAPGDFGQGQISRILHAMNGGSPQVSEIKLARDRNGNKIGRDDAIFQPAIPRTNTMMLDYDAADRLVESTVLRGSTLLRDTTYGLDRMGNRTNVTGAASCSGSYFMDALVPGPLDFQMNQYTTTPCDARSYDENGNLVTRGAAAGPTTYQYDFADRLVQVQSVDFSSGSVVITTSTYVYDALGRRISKTVSLGGLPPVTTQYSHDVVAAKDNDDRVMRFRPGLVIEERENGLVTASFVLDATRSQDDGVIQMRRAGQDYYYHTDDQGNVLALTGANGAVVERYDYGDYGAVTFLTSDGIPTSATSSSVGNPYCWHGLRLDAETGLQNNDGGGYVETQSGQLLIRYLFGLRGTALTAGVRGLDGNNPWSGGGGGGSPRLRAMFGLTGTAVTNGAIGGGSRNAREKGTVKFFNEAKGFGMVTGGGGGGGGGFYFKASKDITLKGQKILQN